jgi:hypothetical protein
VVSVEPDPAAGTRRVVLRLHSDGKGVMVDIPRARLASWSLGDPLPEPIAGRTTILAVFIAPDPAGEVLTLELRGDDPVPIELVQIHAPGDTDPLCDLLGRLPAWTSPKALTLQLVRTSI